MADDRRWRRCGSRRRTRSVLVCIPTQSVGTRPCVATSPCVATRRNTGRIWRNNTHAANLQRIPPVSGSFLAADDRRWRGRGSRSRTRSVLVCIPTQSVGTRPTRPMCGNEGQSVAASTYYRLLSCGRRPAVAGPRLAKPDAKRPGMHSHAKRGERGQRGHAWERANAVATRRNTGGFGLRTRRICSGLHPFQAPFLRQTTGGWRGRGSRSRTRSVLVCIPTQSVGTRPTRPCVGTRPICSGFYLLQTPFLRQTTGGGGAAAREAGREASWYAFPRKAWGTRLRAIGTTLP